ncbi:UNVERIFIED_CONTAM: SUKH-3 immunity protein of toxin-antitoxin system [Acetivibrio alkalicellulosi]
MSNRLDVKEVLKSAGWFEGRKIDTSDMEKKYKEFGYQLFSAVLKFLEEFGNLAIVNTELEEHHHTSPEKVLCEYFKNGKFKDEERYAGERLVLVGETCDRNLLLFVSESGKIYNGTGKLGDSTWEAWEAIINKIGENYKAWGSF